MGPITLFDKSFLQSLSVDEALWFDHFFLANVCPLFYGETLADLDKSVRKGRTPEQEVAIIANKFPEMHGLPCAHHLTLCSVELLGFRVPMTGQVPLADGRRVESEGGRAAVFEPSPEADAFARWQRGEFLDIERHYARRWRRETAILSETEASVLIKALGVSETYRQLEQAMAAATAAVNRGKHPMEWVSLVLNSLGVSEELQQQSQERWHSSGEPTLEAFTPYTAYVLEVEVFFNIALASKLISSGRASNALDIAYLYYLPFCDMFVSSDRLHRNCAPLFLRPDQTFVWGPSLKANLREINDHFLKLPESVREGGVNSFAERPPKVGNEVVSDLWRQLLPNLAKADSCPNKDTQRTPRTPEEIVRLAKSPTMLTSESDWTSGELDQMVIKRNVKARRGSWDQVPPNLSREPHT